MNHPDPYLEAIRQKERQKYNVVNRFFTPVEIQTTAAVASSYIKEGYAPYTEYKPTLLRWLVSAGIPAVFFLVAIVNMQRLVNVSGIIITICTMVFGFLILGGIYVLASEHAPGYPIRVDAAGMKIDAWEYKWEEIYETAILTDGSNKNRKTYLVVVENDKTSYRKYDLKNFVRFSFEGFSVTISKCIEYYKKVENHGRMTNRQ